LNLPANPRRPHVVLDARMARHSGIGRYIRSLSRALLELPGGPRLSLLLDRATWDADWLDADRVRRIRFEAEIYGIREQLLGCWICRREAGPGTVFHIPHYNAPWALPQESVVTVHDTTHFDHSSLAGLRVRLAERVFRRAVERAGRVVVVSAAAAAAIVARIPSAQEKLVIIHHGVDSVFRRLPAEAVEEFRSSRSLRRYLLYVGNDKPHKNLDTLFKAVEGLLGGSDGLELVLAGSPELRRHGERKDVRVETELTDEELARWYNGAAATVLPSFNEGFGLTALESMACGTPFVGSSIPALREVVGDAGHLFDPNSPEQLRNGLDAVLFDRGYRARLLLAAARRISRFDWSTTARMTAEAYVAALGLTQRPVDS